MHEAVLFLKKRIISSLVVFSMLAASLSGCDMSGAEKDGIVVMDIGMSFPEDDFRCKYVYEFGEDIVKKTRGRVSVKYHYLDEYPEQNYMHDDILNPSGKLDMALIAAPYFSDEVPETGVSGLPFMFSDYEMAWEFADSDVNKEVDDLLIQKGVRVLSHFCGSFRNMSDSVRAINSPGDIEGLAMTTVKSKTMLDMFTTLGSVSYSIPAAEMHDAYKKGTYDGGDWSLTTFMLYRLYEVQPYVAITNHAYNLWNFCIRESTWQKISPEDQEIILDAAATAAKRERERVRDSEIERIEEIKAMGVVVTYPETREFAKALEPKREEYAAGFMDTYEKAVEWIEEHSKDTQAHLISGNVY